MFDVIPLTLAISLLLVAVFVYFFWREYSRRRFNSTESDALLPLAEEKPSANESAAKRPSGRDTSHAAR